MQDLASLLSSITKLFLMPRITLKSNIIEELSRKNTLFISRTEVSSNNNIPGNNKALIS